MKEETQEDMALLSGVVLFFATIISGVVISEHQAITIWRCLSPILWALNSSWVIYWRLSSGKKGFWIDDEFRSSVAVVVMLLTQGPGFLLVCLGDLLALIFSPIFRWSPREWLARRIIDWKCGWYDLHRPGSADIRHKISCCEADIKRAKRHLLKLECDLRIAKGRQGGEATKIEREIEETKKAIDDLTEARDLFRDQLQRLGLNGYSFFGGDIQTADKLQSRATEMLAAAQAYNQAATVANGAGPGVDDAVTERIEVGKT